MKSPHIKHLVFSTLAVILLLGDACIAATEDGLVGHWSLTADCQDSSGQENHGVTHGVNFLADGADFNGRDNYIEVPDSETLAPGICDWSIAVWIHTEAKLDDVLGDILCKYDPATRTGVNLGLTANTGATSAQSNNRNLFLGIDAGRVDPEWADCGRPGKSQFIKALCVYSGDLYAGTWEPGKDEAGHVYRYEGGRKWADCGSPDSCNTVSSLAEFQGRLYAGVSFYSGRGSARPESPNKNPGGKVYRYEGDRKWTDCGKIGDVYTVYGLVDFREQLYATTCDSYGCPHPMEAIFRYDGDKKWSICGNPGGRGGAFGVFNGNLYVTVYGNQGLARYDGGEKWTPLGVVPDATQVYSTVIHQGHICVGTWPNALVFRFDGPIGTDIVKDPRSPADRFIGSVGRSNRFTNLGRLGNEKEVMAMSVYNGKLYAGTLPLGEVYRYDADQTWTRTGQLDTTPNVMYRRVWSMAVCHGKLYAGTLPSGRVYSLEAGKVASYDRSLKPGWRHIAAVKQDGKLALYVDGQKVAESTSFNPDDYDLTNHRPLRIGLGEHDYFNGKMKDLRIYSRAIDEEDIRILCKK
jgi:hypothetical protein